MHILHLRNPLGPNFRILGILFDGQLSMAVACKEIAQRAKWKVRTLLATSRYYDVKSLINLYKSHVLSFLESGTPAIYHAAKTHLALIDHVQDIFLRELGVSSEAALMEFNLAPLNTRRDISMLGLIHRTVLKGGTPHFRRWFHVAPRPVRDAAVTRLGGRRHNSQLYDPVDGSRRRTMFGRSAFGLIRIYNLLPQKVVDSRSVKDFQSQLQDLVKESLVSSDDDWPFRFCTHKAGLFQP